MNRDYSIAIYSHDKSGILNRITSVFSRINLNIDALTVCESEKKGIFRHTVQVNCDAKTANRLSMQLERQIDVLKATYHHDAEVIQQEIALYKIASRSLFNHSWTERIIRQHHARILTMGSDFTVIEKTGLKHENQALFEDLLPFGVIEFVRSGPISVSKPDDSQVRQDEIPLFKTQATSEAIVDELESKTNT